MYRFDLFVTLTRFTLHKVAIVADIEKAFLNIGIQEDDRDALKFLWKEDLNTTSKLFTVHQSSFRTC